MQSGQQVCACTQAYVFVCVLCVCSVCVCSVCVCGGVVRVQVCCVYVYGCVVCFVFFRSFHEISNTLDRLKRHPLLSLYACGSSSGVLNLYDRARSWSAGPRPKPVKAFMNLINPLDVATFNHGQKSGTETNAKNERGDRTNANG